MPKAGTICFHTSSLFLAVDHILRPPGRDKAVSIGRFLQGPRMLKEEKIRQLREVAGPKMALSYLMRTIHLKLNCLFIAAS